VKGRKEEWGREGLREDPMGDGRIVEREGLVRQAYGPVRAHDQHALIGHPDQG
jgi:hypothetical protein